MVISKGKPKKLEAKPVPVPLRPSHIKPRSHPELNLRLRGEKPAFNRTGYDTAMRSSAVEKYMRFVDSCNSAVLSGNINLCV
jgi:hypothetical protein